MTPFAVARFVTGAWLRRRCCSVLPLGLVVVSLFASLSLLPSHSSADLRGAPPQADMDCLPANFSVAVTTTILNTFLHVVVVPAILDPSNVLVIPPQAQDHVNVDAMTLRNFQLDTVSLATGTPLAQSMTFHAAGVGLEVDKSRFVFEYLGIKCYGTFWATLNTTNVDAALLLTLLPAGYWNGTFTAINFQWGTLEVHHELDSKMCGLAQKVVELFTGELDALVAKKVQSKLNEDAPARFAESLNQFFARFNLHAITPPLMTSEGMAVVLDANPVPLGCAPAPISAAVPPMLQRDVAVRMAVASVNNLLQNALAAGRLQYTSDLPQELNTSLFEDVIPSVYEACPGCGLTVAASFNTTPVVAVPQSAAISFSFTNLMVGLFVRPSTALEAKALRALKTKSTGVAETGEHPVLQRVISQARLSPRRWGYVPVLALDLGATLAVQHVATPAGRAISYEVLPLERFTVGVEASNIGYVNTTEIVMVGTEVWNSFAVPLMNARSPIKLPFFLSQAVLNLEQSDLQAGISVPNVEALLELLFLHNGAQNLSDPRGAGGEQGWRWAGAEERRV